MNSMKGYTFALCKRAYYIILIVGWETTFTVHATRII
jgi:hypothetical protein